MIFFSKRMVVFEIVVNFAMVMSLWHCMRFFFICSDYMGVYVFGMLGLN